MKLIATTFVTILLLSSTGLAASFSGTVVNSAGEPVGGVNILTNIATLRTITDKDGEFLLEAGLEKPSYLTYSHVSYQPEMIHIADDKDMTGIKIIMIPTP